MLSSREVLDGTSFEKSGIWLNRVSISTLHTVLRKSVALEIFTLTDFNSSSVMRLSKILPSDWKPTKNHTATNWIWCSSMKTQQFSHWISGFAVSPVVRHIDCYRNHPKAVSCVFHAKLIFWLCVPLKTTLYYYIKLTIQGWGWNWWNLSIVTAHYPNYQLWGLPQSRSGHHRIHSCSFSPFSAATVSARTYLRGRRLRGILTGLYFWTMQFPAEVSLPLRMDMLFQTRPKSDFKNQNPTTEHQFCSTLHLGAW